MYDRLFASDIDVSTSAINVVRTSTRRSRMNRGDHNCDEIQFPPLHSIYLREVFSLTPVKRDVRERGLRLRLRLAKDPIEMFSCIFRPRIAAVISFSVQFRCKGVDGILFAKRFVAFYARRSDADYIESSLADVVKRRASRRARRKESIKMSSCIFVSRWSLHYLFHAVF